MLKVENLSYSYGDMQVLWDVDFEVTKGEISSLVGSNGAGKSTLLKCVSGLVPVSKGRIYFEDQEVTSLSTDERVRRGLIHVPEARRIFPDMSVLENLKIGAFNSSAREKSASTLEKVFLTFPILKERMSQSGGTLSGGEQQMLAIGRGLMAQPKLLMLDEPSLGLSPLMVKNIFKVIQEINKLGVTILLVEQNVNQSLKISNRASVIETGRIGLRGTGQELLVHPHVRKAFLGL